MHESSRHVLSAIGGALLALVLVFTFATIGMLPVRPSQSAQNEMVHRYLIAHPEVLVEMTNTLQARDDANAKRKQAEALARIGQKKFFSPDVAFVTGPADAKTTLVEFFDYNCPYCRASLPAVKKFYTAHKDTARFSFIEFPIKGRNSALAARAAIAARKQPDKYLAFHFLLMGEEELVTDRTILTDAEKAGLNMDKLQADMKDPATTKSIQAALKLAQDAGIDGTPTFIIDGKMQSGALDEAELAKLAKG
jgi:protein-disulfide isomerase